jgi:hypothetical protein
MLIADRFGCIHNKGELEEEDFFELQLPRLSSENLKKLPNKHI